MVNPPAWFVTIPARGDSHVLVIEKKARDTNRSFRMLVTWCTATVRTGGGVTTASINEVPFRAAGRARRSAHFLVDRILDEVPFEVLVTAVVLHHELRTGSALLRIRISLGVEGAGIVGIAEAQDVRGNF
jgi:hypothetical protein